MEVLPSWLRDRYQVLLNAFQHHVFSWQDAAATLDVPEGTLGDILTTLERTGYLVKDEEPMDRRGQSYRLVQVGLARELCERLERWRQSGSRSAPPLSEAIDELWMEWRAILSDKIDLSMTPQQPGRLAVQSAAGTVKLKSVSVERVADLDHLGKEDQNYAREILKLFDASSNAYRSLTNALLEHEKLRQNLNAGVYDLPIASYAAVDGAPLKSHEPVSNKSLCPVCRRFEQNQTALALITGNPKMDSVFQVYRASQDKRASIRVCAYCFTSGWVDLPTAAIEKGGQSITKGREYLFITTPLARGDIQQLLDAVASRDLDLTGERDQEEAEEVARLTSNTVEPEELGKEAEDETFTVAAFDQFLREKYGVEGFDTLAVLGVSRQRLRELRGFVLPSVNRLQRVVAIRVPVQRLVGENKVSGAVRRELIKATMYEFWLITGGSLHYNRIVNEVPFSVDGCPITLEEMRRANVAYQLANRFARTGRHQQLNSGLFMLLLSQPVQAANTILRNRHRDRRFAPGTVKVKEVIELTEHLVQPDWKFDLGLHIVDVLVDVGLLLKAEGFRYGPGPQDVYSGVDLVKWLQRLKMVRDETSARAWANMLLNALKRGDLAYREYIQAHGGQIGPPGKEKIRKIMDLVDSEDGIIQTCSRHGCKLSELSRDIANMDYYLLFYHNQHQATGKEPRV